MGPGASATAKAVILPPGETLGGFRVMDVLGIGGMAVVYRAEQLSLQREVALKVLSADLGEDALFAERFRREGMHVSRLDHPNIIPIYDAGADKGRLFLAMRLVDGMTLSERIRARQLSATETLQILTPIADGLDCAHAAGLIHRDVKPQNILLTESGHPYLTDFGVATSVDTVGMTRSGGFVGSFHYAAPEQVVGATTSAATDVYALTVVLFQCVTGTVPHARYTEAGVLFAHVNEPPPRLAHSEAHAFNGVIERGMAKDPADRYASAGELLDAAKRVLDVLPSPYQRQRPTFPAAAALPDEPRAEPAAEVTTERPRRPTRRIAAGVVALVGIGVLAIGLLLSAGRPARASARIARSGGLAIAYRPPWTPTRRAFASTLVTPVGSAGQGPIELRLGDSTMAAGQLLRSAAIPGGTPPGLTTRFGRAAASSGRLADGAEVERYAWASAHGRAVDAWVIPTARGDLAIICAAPRALGTPLRQCAAMAIRARLTGVGLLAVGRDVGLADALQRAAGVALAARSAIIRHRNAKPWSSRTVATMASADTRAVTTLRSLDVPARYGRVVSALAASFADEAHALSALASADRKHDRTQYKSASAAIVKADRRLEMTSRQAVRSGLLNTTVGSLAVPAWPVLVTPPVASSGGYPAAAGSGATTPTPTTTTSPSYPSTYSPPAPSQSQPAPSVQTGQTQTAQNPPSPLHGNP